MHNSADAPNNNEAKSLNFLEEIIEKDIAANVNNGRVLTRFPPEPNGYLHLGHCSSIHLNFGLAAKYNGNTNLRFDDTNPATEETEYVNSIKNDIAWLGYKWANEFYASDYFENLYAFAIKLIEQGLAYVDDSSSEEIAKQKGDLNTPGTNSPNRNKSVEENLDLFTRMRAGEFADGAMVLRAKIDMASPNMIMRDPLLYRIKRMHHHRTGNNWCIYPMYDFAHGQSDSIENITHSICTLEFIPHRELYNWCIDKLNIFPSKQYEFARVNINYTVMSKRKLLQLVNEKFVSGWDDPRMPTISGVRRRGYTPESIKDFCDRVGVSKRDKLIEIGLLEFCVREHLNKIALRRMAVLNPLKVTITNFDSTTATDLSTENNPEDEHAGTRPLTFGNTLWIEEEDFMENPPKGYFRLYPGASVRLKSAYIITCNDVVKDANGKVIELLCTYAPNSKSGQDTSGIKVKGTIHWLNANECANAEIRIYDRLFKVENPNSEEGDFKDYINENSLTIIPNAYIEKALLQAQPADRFQFLRHGYFCLDTTSTADKLVFNKTVSLKDTWAKVNKG
jgi:glutaminyl-tRNA synthetase